MRLWTWLCDTTEDGEFITLSAGEMARQTGLSIRSIRESIKRLETDKVVTVERRIDPKSGAQLSNKIRVDKRIARIDSVEVATALAVYTKLVGQRTRRKENIRKFSSYKNVFRKVVYICLEHDIDVVLYIRAIFYIMPRGWCKKVFKKFYPEPPMLVNSKKAKMRYDKYLHYLEDQYGPRNKENLKDKIKHMAQLVVDLNVEDEQGFRALYNTGLIDKKFMNVMIGAQVPEPEYQKIIEELLK